MTPHRIDLATSIDALRGKYLRAAHRHQRAVDHWLAAQRHGLAHRIAGATATMRRSHEVTNRLHALLRAVESAVG